MELQRSPTIFSKLLMYDLQTTCVTHISFSGVYWKPVIPERTETRPGVYQMPTLHTHLVKARWEGGGDQTPLNTTSTTSYDTTREDMANLNSPSPPSLYGLSSVIGDGGGGDVADLAHPDSPGGGGERINHIEDPKTTLSKLKLKNIDRVVLGHLNINHLDKKFAPGITNQE